MATNRADLPWAKNATFGLGPTYEFSHMDVDHGLAVFQVRSPGKSSPLPYSVPLSQIAPDTFEDRTELWEMLIEALFERLSASGARPSFVRGFEVQRGEDSTGDPALFVTILVTPTPGPANEALVAARSTFADGIQEALLQLHLQRYPYVRVGEWRRKR